jgi:tetrapyrrole methylase family protein/MazG family protein
MVNHKKFNLDVYNDHLTELDQLHPGIFEKGVQLIDGRTLSGCHYPPFTPGLPVLIECQKDSPSLVELRELLLSVYPPKMDIFVLTSARDRQLQWNTVTIAELFSLNSTVSAVCIPVNPTAASLEEFMEIIGRLRAPDGCPWDRKQTHSSLRQYLLEETYEALEALDKADVQSLKEELGDLLLQIALHSQIAAESQTFTISEVFSGINAKIVSRHPHVFGEVKVRDEIEVVQNWEKLKEIERSENGSEDIKGLLDGIPSILPALSQAQSIQERAARVGFDWPEIAPVVAKVLEELKEVEDAPSVSERALELGDLLFAVVNLVRWYKVDAESALRQTNQKFRNRFAHLEERSRASGKELQKMTLEEMDALWEEAKGLEY